MSPALTESIEALIDEAKASIKRREESDKKMADSIIAELQRRYSATK